MLNVISENSVIISLIFFECLLGNICKKKKELRDRSDICISDLEQIWVLFFTSVIHLPQNQH